MPQQTTCMAAKLYAPQTDSKQAGDWQQRLLLPARCQAQAGSPFQMCVTTSVSPFYVSHCYYHSHRLPTDFWIWNQLTCAMTDNIGDRSFITQ